jgi:spore germination protein KA
MGMYDYLEIQTSLQENINRIKNSLHHTSDLVVRNLSAGLEGSFRISMVYLDGIIDSDRVQEYVVKPLLEAFKTEGSKEPLVEQIIESVIESADAKTTNQYKDLTDAIVQGNTIILINGYRKGIIIPSVMWKERSIEEALGERSPRGPVIGLTEKMKTNINLIRSALKTPDLCIESIDVGTKAKTAVSILYLEGIVDKGILNEVNKRVRSINIKYLPSSSIVEDAIDGKPPSFFSLSRTSERIDSIVSSLFEGRIAVIVDGYPYAIIAPVLFMEFLQAPDEYHTKRGRFTLRFLRFIGFLCGIYLPAIYIAVANFHKDDLSKKLAKILITDVEVLPTFWEVFILLLLVRMLIDASFRLPKSAVILVSLIGTVVIGQTAVTAKLIHPISLITVGITFLSSFLVINRGLGAAEDTLRYLSLFIAQFFGFNGLIISTTLLLIYMVSLKSVGVPYLSPLIPFRIHELKDTLYRGNLQKLVNSPHTYSKNKE